jgi:hypothetical protein
VDLADELANCFALVAAEVIQDNDIAGSKDGQKNPLDTGANAHAIDRPSMNHGASIRSWRRVASKVMVFQRARRTVAGSLFPRGVHPRKDANSLSKQRCVDRRQHVTHALR